MKNVKFKIFRLEGCSLGVGYYSKSVHIVVLFWNLTIEFKR